MILRSIRAEGWRCFANPVELGPLADGINIVHAPNATGKSSLLSALVRGLFDSHRVTGKDVESLRPWGRDLAPGVTLVFEHDGASYRLAKRFLDQPHSRLERKEGGKYVRVAEGEKADEYARAMLSAQAPGRGMAKATHWGLGQVLYVPQGELALGGVAGDLASLIRQSLGHQIGGPEATPIERRVRDLYLRFFTEKGRVRSGKEAPAFVEKGAELERLRNRKRELLADVQDFEEAARSVQDFSAQRHQAKRDAEALAEILRQVRTRSDEYVKLLGERETQQARIDSAQARYRGLRQRIQEIQNARLEIEETRHELARLKQNVPAQAREMESLKERADAASLHLETVRKDYEKSKALWNDVELAQRFEQARESVARVGDLLGRIEEARAELEQKRRLVAEVAAPDKAALAKIRKAMRERDDTQARLDAALITLEIVPEKPGTLEIVAGDATGSRSFSGGERLEIRGSPEVSVNVKGVAAIKARGPAGSVEELRRDLAAATRRIEDLTAGFGCSTIEALEDLHERAAGLKNQVEAAEARLETLLGGRKQEEIEQDRTRAERILQAVLSERPAWAQSFPGSEPLKAAAKAFEAGFVSRVRGAEAERDAALASLGEAREQHSRLLSRVEALERTERQLAGRLAELQKDGLTDQSRAEEAERVALEWQAAQSMLKQIEERLAGFESDPRAEVQKLEAQQEALQEKATQALEKQKRAEGRLAEIAARGSYAELAAVEEQLAALETEVKAEKAYADSVRLLHETLTACRSEVMEVVAGPVEASAARILRRIAGPRMGSLKLGESFEVAAVVPSGLDQRISTEELSGGEKEQIHLAVRLALADLLARNGRELVVLDDVLTATDAGRFARILTVLEEYAQRLQILIFTCHPERYSGLAGAQFFDLAELSS